MAKLGARSVRNEKYELGENFSERSNPDCQVWALEVGNRPRSPSRCISAMLIHLGLQPDWREIIVSSLDGDVFIHQTLDISNDVTKIEFCHSL